MNTNNHNETRSEFYESERIALRQRIVRRVYLIWFAKKLLSPRAVKAYIFAGFLAEILGTVSVRNVIANSPSFSDVTHTSEFFGSAFVNTDMTVQISLFAIIFMAAWLLHDMFLEKEYV